MSSAGHVAIIGAGMTRFGDNFHLSYGDMVVEAATLACRDAGVGMTDIQAAWLGTAYAYDYGTEGNAGTSLAEPLALPPIPVTRVSNYCTSGLDAVRAAALAVAAGEYDVVLVAGVEKMRDVPPRGSLVATHVGRGHPLYAKGRTAPGMFGLMARRYAQVYGDPRPAMTAVAVKNHHYGSLNPNAHHRQPVTPEQVQASLMVADPLRLLDCTPTSDGAAALVLTRADRAGDYRRGHVVIRGLGLAVTGGYFSAQFDSNWDFLGFRSTREASRQAYAQAGIREPWREIDVAEVHDCFTITEIINYEDLGFCPPGQGTRLVLDGQTGPGGSLPVNTSGGLQSCGHPIGATGVRMVVEVTDQLLGRAGQRQVAGARVGLAHALGGPGAVAGVAVLGRVE